MAARVGTGVRVGLGVGDGVALGRGLAVGTGVKVDVDTRSTLVGVRVGLMVGAVEVHLTLPKIPNIPIKTSPRIQFARIVHLAGSVQ